MPLELKVPEVGESISEVLIGDWLKSEGEHVERDEEVVVIETDKATLEVAAPASGTLSKVLKRTGDKASVGDVIGYLEAGGAAATPSATGNKEGQDRSQAKRDDSELEQRDQRAEERAASPVGPSEQE